MSRRIKWSGDRKKGLPAEDLAPRKKVDLYDPAYVARLSGPVRHLSPAEVARLSYRRHVPIVIQEGPPKPKRP